MNELVRLVRLFSSSWEDKNIVLKQIHDQQVRWVWQRHMATSRHTHVLRVLLRVASLLHDVCACMHVYVCVCVTCSKQRQLTIALKKIEILSSEVSIVGKSCSEP